MIKKIRANQFRDLRKAIELRPTDPEAYTEIGYALHQLARYGEAIQQYQIALKQKADPALRAT